MSTRKRAVGIKINLTQTTHDDLVLVAEAIGQTPATAAAFAIGQWVSQQKRALGATENAINAMVREAAPELLKHMSLIGGKP